MPEEFNFFPCRRLDRLIAVFHALFAAPYNTRLQGGAPEPVYQPGTAPGEQNLIVFTRDHVSSALHEVAHWCLAGAARRRRVDYGYWYAPDGRTDQQQREFERVEIEPQAVERIFSRACRQPFRVSADNLHTGQMASPRFIAAIQAQTLAYCRRGLPPRAARFALALAAAFDVPDPLCPRRYGVEGLR